MRISTKKLAICGLLTAIGIVMKLYFASVPLLVFGTQSKIPFSYMITYVAGFAGGPILGAICGILIDLLGTLLAGQYPILGLSLTSGVLGLTSGLIYMISKKKNMKPILIVAAVLVGQLLCSVVLNSYVLYLNGIIGKGQSFGIVVGARILPQLFYIPLISFIEVIIMRAYDKLQKRKS